MTKNNTLLEIALTVVATPSPRILVKIPSHFHYRMLRAVLYRLAAAVEIESITHRRPNWCLEIVYHTDYVGLVRLELDEDDGREADAVELLQRVVTKVAAELRSPT